MITPLVVLGVCSVLVGIVHVADPLNWGANRLVEFPWPHAVARRGHDRRDARPPPEFHLRCRRLEHARRACQASAWLCSSISAIRTKRVCCGESATWKASSGRPIRSGSRGWSAAAGLLQRRDAARVGLGFVVALLGFCSVWSSLVLSLPLVVATFLTPYRLSRDKFYFDEIYDGLVVWPLRVVSAGLLLDRSLGHRWLGRFDGPRSARGRLP